MIIYRPGVLPPVWARDVASGAEANGPERPGRITTDLVEADAPDADEKATDG